MFDQIDIHGCTTTEAKIKLDNFLNNLNPLISEITIIHGYSSKILQQYVRKQYKQKNISQSFNNKCWNNYFNHKKIRSLYGIIIPKYATTNSSLSILKKYYYKLY